VDIRRLSLVAGCTFSGRTPVLRLVPDGEANSGYDDDHLKIVSNHHHDKSTSVLLYNPSRLCEIIMTLTYILLYCTVLQIMRVCVCAECECEKEREKERKRARVCVCVLSMAVLEIDREMEREREKRERKCVCVLLMFVREIELERKREIERQKQRKKEIE